MKVKANENRHSGIWRGSSNTEDGARLILGAFTSLKDGGKQETNASLNHSILSKQGITGRRAKAERYET